MADQDFLLIGLGVTGFVILMNLFIFMVIPMLPSLVKKFKAKKAS